MTVSDSLNIHGSKLFARAALIFTDATTGEREVIEMDYLYLDIDRILYAKMEFPNIIKLRYDFPRLIVDDDSETNDSDTPTELFIVGDVNRLNDLLVRYHHHIRRVD